MDNPSHQYNEALRIKGVAYQEFLAAFDIAVEKRAAFKLATINADRLREVARTALQQPTQCESYD
jgi:hypothetical protein